VEAPKTHLTKGGNTHDGGALSFSRPSSSRPFLWGNIGNIYVVLILFVTATLGAVGFLDDYLKVVKKKKKRPYRFGTKLPGRFLSALSWPVPSTSILISLIPTCGKSSPQRQFRFLRTGVLTSACSIFPSLSWSSRIRQMP